MKKIFAVLLVLSMILAFTACDENLENTATGEGPTNSINITDIPSQEMQDSTTQETTSETTCVPTLETQNNTQSTTENTTGETNPTATTSPATELPPTTPPTMTQPTTTPPTTEAPTTQPAKPHMHNYTPKITTAATCTANGVKTFACTCGASYTEDIEAKGHNMGGWKLYASATNFSPEEKRNTCLSCGEYQSEKQYDKMLKHYAWIAHVLPSFSTPQELQNMTDDFNIITAAVWFGGVGGETVENGDGWPITKVKVSNMDSFTNKCFNKTYDYTNVNELPVLYQYYDDKPLRTCTYDKDLDALIINGEVFGVEHAGWIQGIEYITDDDVHFTIKITHEYIRDPVRYSTMTVELINGKYIITSNIW